LNRIPQISTASWLTANHVNTTTVHIYTIVIHLWQEYFLKHQHILGDAGANVHGVIVRAQHALI
jgi:pantothenate kinase